MRKRVRDPDVITVTTWKTIIGVQTNKKSQIQDVKSLTYLKYQIRVQVVKIKDNGGKS